MTRKSPASPATNQASAELIWVAPRSAAECQVAVRCSAVRLFVCSERNVEGLAMAEQGKSRWGGLFGSGQLATQAAVLLPVMAIAVMSAWTMGAKGQSVEATPQAVVAVQSTSPSDAPPAPAKP